jgi:hypothetical protein
MRAIRLAFACLLLAAPGRPAQPSELDAEVARVDAAGANPDHKLVVVAVLAEHLKVHRNHLVFLRKQTGDSYGRIFVASLEESGASKADILRQLRSVNAEIERRLRSEPVRLSPVFLVSSAADHSSLGTFYTVTPEIGFETRHAALVIGAPFYRNSAVSFTAGGLGDAYVAGYLRGAAGRFDFGTSLTVGLPTGDPLRGLGAGETTADGAGVVGVRLAAWRLFAGGGYTNSVFANVGYQRPYISEGPAAHFSGGLEVTPHRRLRLGAGGFAVRPHGEQQVYSRLTDMHPTAPGIIPPGTPAPKGWPKNWPWPPQGQIPAGQRTGPLRVHLAGLLGLQQAQWLEAPAQDLQDHGVNAWASIGLFPGVSLDFAAARSVPFRLTTVRAGLVFDVAHWIGQVRHGH